MSKLSVRLIICVLCIGAGACAGGRDRAALSLLETEQQLYEDSRRLMEKNRFDLAIQRLVAIEEHFPFGVYSEQAQLEMLFALNRLGRHEEVAVRAERFLTQNPKHSQTPYVLYVQGQSAYQSNFGFASRLFKTDVSQRDMGRVHNAYQIFAVLMRDYPDNPYRDDVRQQMTYLSNIIARHELVVANYYLKRRAWLSSVRRAQGIITNHEGYPQTDDALAIMVYAYQKMGLDELAEDSLSVLRNNYPDYPSLRNGTFIGPPSISQRNAFYRYTIGQIVAPGPLFDTR